MLARRLSADVPSAIHCIGFAPRSISPVRPRPARAATRCYDDGRRPEAGTRDGASHPHGARGVGTPILGGIRPFPERGGGGTRLGFAEATLFFVVPDIWIGLLALFSWRAGLRAVIWAVWALIGGTLMYGVGAQLDHDRSARLLDAVPAISPGMIEQVEEEMRERGPASMLLGPLRARPTRSTPGPPGSRSSPRRGAPLDDPRSGRTLRLGCSRLRPLRVVGPANHIADGLAPRSVPARLDRVLYGLLLGVRVLTAASPLHATGEDEPALMGTAPLIGEGKCWCRMVGRSSDLLRASQGGTAMPPSQTQSSHSGR